jgi:hypothetical protein
MSRALVPIRGSSTPFLTGLPFSSVDSGAVISATDPFCCVTKDKSDDRGDESSPSQRASEARGRAERRAFALHCMRGAEAASSPCRGRGSRGQHGARVAQLEAPPTGRGVGGRLTISSGLRMPNWTKLTLRRSALEVFCIANAPDIPSAQARTGKTGEESNASDAKGLVNSQRAFTAFFDEMEIERLDSPTSFSARRAS